MLTNQRGSTLLTVLIINLVLIILGMSIISATIGSAKRTAMRDSEISITYGAMDAVNAFTTELAKNLNEFKISTYFSDSNKNLYESNLKINVLEKTITNLLEENNKTINKDLIKCINLINLTGKSPSYVFHDTGNPILGACLEADLKTHKDYQSAGLNLQDNLTRVYDLVITTTNPIETQGNVEKLVTKRMILSPLPSFLRYAVGSESLYLNGSSNIVGNVFAEENLTLKNKANYSTSTSPNLVTSENQFPSIIGKIYSTNAEILEKLKPGNFYNETVPNLLHDSQFANINFDETFMYSIRQPFTELKLKATAVNVTSLFDDFTDNIITEVNDNSPSTQLIPEGIEPCTKENENGGIDYIPGCYKTNGTKKTISSISFIKDPNASEINLTIDNELEIIEGLYVNGNIAIEVNKPLTIKGPIYVNGNITIYSNAPLIIDKNYANQTFNSNGNIKIIGSNSVRISSNIFTTGSITFTNLNSNLVIDETIISKDKINIISTAQETSDINNTKISKELISGSDLTITTENMETIINNNLFINGNFIISGNQESNNEKEKDNVLFNSVIYVNGSTTISNTNISALNVSSSTTEELKNGNLVLLSKGKLLLTRINEFRYYEEESEKTINYLPLEDKNIKPIKGFFYTDSNAELYGVGSLFYVHGGIFAKDELVINAVRGKTAINQFSPSESKDKLSRFIVKYDDSILFNSLTSLPIVKNLQLIMDEQTVQ